MKIKGYCKICEKKTEQYIVVFGEGESKTKCIECGTVEILTCGNLL